MGVSEKSLTLEVGGKDRVIYVNVEDSQPKPNTCIVIGHGASGDATSGNLPRIANALAEEGHLVMRYNAGGQLPARCKLLQGILDSKIEALEGASSFILCGHSMGGRTACAVARERGDVRGVLLLSYPLHPPGKPGQLRDEDLVALDQPVMIVRGSKDAFSTEGPFSQVTGRMASERLRIVNVSGGDHSLGTKTTAGENRFAEWMEEVKEFVAQLANDKGWEAGRKPIGKEGEADQESKKGKKDAITESEAKAVKRKSNGKAAKGGAKESAVKPGGKATGKPTTGAGRKAASKAQRSSEADSKKGAKRQKTGK